MIVRDAREEDAAGILWIYNDAVAHSTAIWNETPVDLANRVAWLNDRTSKGFPVLAAVEGEQVLGYSSFGPFRPNEGYRLTVESSVYVRPDHWRKGVGKSLMRELIGRAKSMGMHVMVAAIESGNVPSIRLHESLEFLLTACLPQVGMKFGQWLNLSLMLRRLDEREKP